jgi:hypothetical protein
LMITCQIVRFILSFLQLKNFSESRAARDLVATKFLATPWKYNQLATVLQHYIYY